LVTASRYERHRRTPETKGEGPWAPVAFHPEQGWSLLCNGVIVFDDMGAILAQRAKPQ